MKFSGNLLEVRKQKNRILPSVLHIPSFKSGPAGAVQGCKSQQSWSSPSSKGTRNNPCMVGLITFDWLRCHHLPGPPGGEEASQVDQQHGLLACITTGVSWPLGAGGIASQHGRRMWGHQDAVWGLWLPNYFYLLVNSCTFESIPSPLNKKNGILPPLKIR